MSALALLNLSFTGSLANATTIWSTTSKLFLSFRTHNATVPVKRSGEDLAVDYGFELTWKGTLGLFILFAFHICRFVGLVACFQSYVSS
jgi:hypothetical protein